MYTTESVTLHADPDAVFPFVVDLSAYPRWLPLVHDAEPAPSAPDAHPAWFVELRARIGPLARSKRLRMERVEQEPGRLAVFERAEQDGRHHARWSLRVELTSDGLGTPGPDSTPDSTSSTSTSTSISTTVTMHLAYDGAFWTGGLLESVLDEQIRRGRTGLAELVSDAATR